MSDFKTSHRLWAPWRMEFIRAPKEKECFLCRILREGAGKDSQNLVVRRGADCLLLLNRYPYNSGHLMVAPFRHVGTLGEMTAAERGEMMDLACLAERLLEKVVRPQGFNVGINEGAAAGAGLKDHLHLHVVPRWEGDTNFMPALGNVRVVPQALDEMHAALMAELARGEG
ncbi:MAG: HIT domain-containing protein [Kiritimatiellia bacterium]